MARTFQSGILKFAALGLLACGTGTFAQTSSDAAAAPITAPSLEVQRLAPQLVGFAGSVANFQSLANGLALGLPVTLVSATPDGFLLTATFTPAGAMSALDVARTLEAARQQLISRGIATPSAQQIGVALLGGQLPTALGSTPVTGLLAVRTPAEPASASTGASARPRDTIAPGASVTTAPPALALDIRPVSGASSTAAQPGTIVPPATLSASPQLRSTSESPFTRNLSDTPLPVNASRSATTTSGSASTGASVTSSGSPPAGGEPSPAVQMQNRR
jgi:hypothetical protein